MRGTGFYDGADNNLTLSFFKNSTLKTTNAEECFLNYSKMEQPVGQWRVQERGKEGWEMIFYVSGKKFYGAWALGNPPLS